MLLKWHKGCDISAITRDDASVCTWYDLISAVNKSVRDLALELLSRPTIFIVVGDHSPPFDMDYEPAEFSAHSGPRFQLLPKLGVN